MFYTDTLFLHFYQNVVFTGCIRYFFYIIPKENGHFLVENCNIFLQNNYANFDVANGALFVSFPRMFYNGRTSFFGSRRINCIFVLLLPLNCCQITFFLLY